MATTSVVQPPSDEAREKALDEIEAKIDEHGVKHVYLQYTSVPGRVLAKVLPARHFRRVARSGVAWPYSTAGGFAVLSQGDVAGPHSTSHREGVLIPDLSTFRVLPWDSDMARVICDHYNDSRHPEAGELASGDARANLKRMVVQFDAELGLEMRTGCEPEMSWFPSREQVTAAISRLPSHIGTGYHVDHIDDQREIVKRVTRYGQELGLDMIQADYEDPGQIEMNFMFGPALDTADRLTTYRQICLQVARELDVFATFMPKPISGIMGNGCHHHLSLWREGEAAFSDPGQKSLNETGRWAVGGILKHARALSAVCSPTVNSYARYWDPGQYAPSVPVWGLDNRQCVVRVLGNRLEFRAPDASCNPYLSHAVLIAAVRDGIANEIDPGDPYTNEDVPPGPEDTSYPLLPRTLWEALEALAEDDVIRGAMPGDLYDTFMEVKKDEWFRSCGAITDWQLDTYLNYLP